MVEVLSEVTVSDGVIVASGATISNAGGNGYQVGDVLGITTIGNASVGRNVRLTVTGIGQTNELILDNVQGEFSVGAAKTMMYINSAGITTELNYGLPGGEGGDIQISTINVDSDGLHLKVNHQNHGMYFPDNRVIISGVSPDIKPTKLSASYHLILLVDCLLIVLLTSHPLKTLVLELPILVIS